MLQSSPLLYFQFKHYEQGLPCDPGPKIIDESPGGDTSMEPTTNIYLTQIALYAANDQRGPHNSLIRPKNQDWEAVKLSDYTWYYGYKFYETE